MRIGISYSWDDDEHKKWVRTLADRLRAAGFEVIYDGGQRLGQRLPHFMEQMVSRSDRVLVVCTANYKQRFDDRVGGIGYEGNLISGEIVRNHGTIKFIPLLRRNSWPEALPRCLDGMLGLDFIGTTLFEERWTDLVSELQVSTPQAEIDIGQDEPEWTDRLTYGAADVREALAAIRQQGHEYYRVIEMHPNPRGYEKSNNDIIRALKESVVWHDDHPWPISVGLLEFLLKVDDDDIAHDPYVKTKSYSGGVSYSLRMDHMQRFEYIEARRDCSVTIVETEDFHWFRHGQLMFDKAIGTTSDALKFWPAFYKTLLGANPVDFQVRWHGLRGLRLTAMEGRFVKQVPTLAISPRICEHDDPIASDVLSGSTPDVIRWERDFVGRTTGFLFGQFRFDPDEQLVTDILTAYHANLGGPPTNKFAY